MSDSGNNLRKNFIKTLFLACKTGKLKMIKLLMCIDRENFLNATNILHCFLLEIALKYDQFEIFCFLIRQKIDKNSINVEHENILPLAQLGER